MNAVATRSVLVLADQVGATQHISWGQPLAAPQADGRIVLAMESEQKAWKSKFTRADLLSLHQPDVLVLSRYTGALAPTFVDDARKAGIPSIFHIDDDLMDVPMSLGAAKYDHYHAPERLAALRAAMDGVDLVYASTAPLAERLAGHGIAAPIVSGDLYCSVDAGTMLAPLPAATPVVGYMGTGGHSADLDMVLPAVTRLMHDMPSLRFETFGTIASPPAMAAFGARYAHHAGIADYARFTDWLHELGWWVGVAPLEDNPFNRCKADTKWVEYSMAGVAVVASDLPLYRRGCADGAGLLARDSDGWQAAIGALVRSAVLRRQQVALARRRLRDGYDRPLLERQVLAVLDDAVRRHHGR